LETQTPTFKVDSAPEEELKKAIEKARGIVNEEKFEEQVAGEGVWIRI
jgi:hypothetical protein